MTMRLDADLYAEVFEWLAADWSGVTEAVDVDVSAVGCAPAMSAIRISLPVRGE
jgi:Ni,Fe-hydrogenase III small subunit